MIRLCCILLAGLAAVSPLLAADSQPATLPLGAPAPDFSLPGVEGKSYALKDFAQAKILVLVFTCNHCPVAQQYEERLKQLARDYQGKGVAVVAIMPNDARSVPQDSFTEMKLRARDRHFNFPYLYDGATQSVSRAYGPVATPHAFVFGAQRKLRYVGAIDDSEDAQHVRKHYLREALDALLAGQEPPVTRTKAVGCSIKWAAKAEPVQPPAGS
jgi:peroxiredoxin